MGLGFKMGIKNPPIPKEIPIFVGGTFYKKVTATKSLSTWGETGRGDASNGYITLSSTANIASGESYYARSTVTIDLSKIPNIKKYKRMTFNVSGSWQSSNSSGGSGEWSVSVGGKSTSGIGYNNPSAWEFTSGSWYWGTQTLNDLSNISTISITLTNHDGAGYTVEYLSLSNIRLYLK